MPGNQVQVRRRERTERARLRSHARECARGPEESGGRVVATQTGGTSLSA